MLSLDSHRRYYCYRGASDMRKGFDALAGMVRTEFDMNPLSGDVFIFFNRRKNQVKLLSWEKDGFCLYYKRLEKGTYEIPSKEGQGMVIRPEVLQCILSGISIKHITLRKRYVRAV